MPASDDLRDGLAEAYDTLAAEFQSGVTVKLLRESTTTDAFEELILIDNSRFWEYSNFRKNTLLKIAIDGDTSFTSISGIIEASLTVFMNEATHVAIDSDVYVILQGDTLPPSGTQPVWQLFLELYERREHFAAL